MMHTIGIPFKVAQSWSSQNSIRKQCVSSGTCGCRSSNCWLSPGVREICKALQRLVIRKKSAMLFDLCSSKCVAVVEIKLCQNRMLSNEKG